MRLSSQQWTVDALSYLALCTKAKFSLGLRSNLTHNFNTLPPTIGQASEVTNSINTNAEPENESHTTKRSYDWILISGNTHYARDRASFKDYTAINTIVGENRVLGIGVVELAVVRSPPLNLSGFPMANPGASKLILADVLHMPDMVCNGICSMLLGGRQFPGPNGSILGYQHGRRAYYSLPFYGADRVRVVAPGSRDVMDRSSPWHEASSRRSPEACVCMEMTEMEWAVIQRQVNNLRPTRSH